MKLQQGNKTDFISVNAISRLVQNFPALSICPLILVIEVNIYLILKLTGNKVLVVCAINVFCVSLYEITLINKLFPYLMCWFKLFTLQLILWVAVTFDLSICVCFICTEHSISVLSLCSSGRNFCSSQAYQQKAGREVT